ncbi:MAG TPA: branched-chain amino acid transaminase [Ktedonobacterales bacterium]|nr:branched-chain amino acid transaminase [Ktedonobacterales bacterium]
MSKTTDGAALSQRSDMVVFLNGEYIPADQARVGIATHALSYGTGCFEGIRAYYNNETDQLYIFRALEHFERLARSCKIMNIRLPYTPEELVEMIAELIRRNGLRENCYIRPFAYKADEIIGVKLNGLEDHFTMFTMPMGDYISTSGLRCMVSSWRRVDDNMIPARAKISGAYVNSAFAKSEALMGGFDEAIMLTHEGHVSEGSAENIFMVTGGELVTPPPSENILQGITRDTVMQLARRELEMLTRERVIDRTELYTADEIFLTGTGAQIAPVVEVDHRAIGSGKVGTVGAELIRLYGDVTRGRRAEYMSWLTPVYPAVHAKANGHIAHNGHNGAKKAGKSTAAAKK